MRSAVGSPEEAEFLVGARGFEPPTSRSQTERTTRLCYAPNFRLRNRQLGILWGG